MPEISIITPSLNASKVIADCIRSVAEQSGKPQHLVIDGDSSDKTLDVIRSVSEEVDIIQQAPVGIYPAINAGIEASSGEIIGILHADDFYASANVLQRVATAFENPSVDACYGDLCYVDYHQPSKIVRYWRAGAYRPGRLRHGWMPPHPTFFVRRNVYERFGCYRTDLGTAADYELMLRFLLKHGINIVYLPQVLVHMRAGGASNASWKARLAANQMDRRAWKVNGLKPLPWTAMAKPLRKLGQWWSRP